MPVLPRVTEPSASPDTAPPALGARHRFIVLDALRGIAAVAVLTDHLHYDLVTWFPARHLAVDFFFVLSGFVLAHTYEPRLRAGMTAGDFMLRRFVRLWPLYALGTLAAAIIAWSTRQSGADIATALAFGAAFIPILSPDLSMNGVSVFPLNIPAWSLFFELFANLVFAVLAPRLAWPILAAVLVFGAALLFFQTAHLPNLDYGVSIQGFAVGFGRVLWSFFAGVAVYRLWRMRKAPSAPLAVCTLALIGMMAWGHHLVWAFVGFPMLVYLAAGAEPKGVFRAVQTRFGGASYGIYILQWPILLVAERHFRFDSVIQVVVLAVVVVTVALVMDRLFDAPARRWLGRVLSPLVRPRVATAR